ncbi:hypothetical protein HK097_007183 [Rhizophlyctis rosea]|uniref:Yeast cell wall synthesis Kre9/Knh1-like N-terminal domain-containing protein n=1 Tax=Rhizophlyctis rosea TaxID=64517 RepID=A0AAD5X5C8_9FUNG|nr:hypothetical protein HK097_007183 [Rhizophlyctis rosea]
MHFNSILVAALASFSSFSAINAATIVWKTPVPGGATNWKPGQAVTIEWTYIQNGTTNELPNVGPNDVAIFNLQDLRNGANTGENIGPIIGQVPITIGQVVGSIPMNLANGNNYVIRAAIGSQLAYSPQFQISGGTTAPTTTSRASTTTTAAATATQGSGATSNSANVLGALAAGLVAALAA